MLVLCNWVYLPCAYRLAINRNALETLTKLIWRYPHNRAVFVVCIFDEKWDPAANERYCYRNWRYPRQERAGILGQGMEI